MHASETSRFHAITPLVRVEAHPSVNRTHPSLRGGARGQEEALLALLDMHTE